MEIERAMAAQERCGVDLIVIGNAIHDLRGKDRAQQLESVKFLNQNFAGLQDQHEGKLVALAAGVPTGGDEFL
ncbi:MAG: hypothetical protein QGF09_10490, partial [Rhodospirillales bacterium]|nr:hypothetical protein [Rhodospirillales bacterium]